MLVQTTPRYITTLRGQREAASIRRQERKTKIRKTTESHVSKTSEISSPARVSKDQLTSHLTSDHINHLVDRDPYDNALLFLQNLSSFDQPKVVIDTGTGTGTFLSSFSGGTVNGGFFSGPENMEIDTGALAVDLMLAPSSTGGSHSLSPSASVDQAQVQAQAIDWTRWDALLGEDPNNNMMLPPLFMTELPE
ncbi:uncharacterized protein Z518_03290 [Rhinocladiella mackenziei CBS 650.93]|uniref:Rhinocladiella mackenziei CBS 650.93 unplaced genomic scaffold supercont1.2, whole genome shotgun sequence n=1 Tax=Rhinocladiella mackenziei CBS 650.93 TaxID=1442369 RepID=A0A0D2HDL6_9EURO|nr:uncharacterized protein Z518_03290 [Rhinocladiella mackenziei CBS 650.93]KIX08633.1 hypothetical protein Z518_03290 [Rhinocladiella mackenziei CBS 650.93]